MDTDFEARLILIAQKQKLVEDKNSDLHAMIAEIQGVIDANQAGIEKMVEEFKADILVVGEVPEQLKGRVTIIKNEKLVYDDKEALKFVKANDLKKYIRTKEELDKVKFKSDIEELKFPHSRPEELIVRLQKLGDIAITGKL